jgi:hypothetical protein
VAIAVCFEEQLPIRRVIKLRRAAGALEPELESIFDEAAVETIDRAEIGRRQRNAEGLYRGIHVFPQGVERLSQRLLLHGARDLFHRCPFPPFHAVRRRTANSSATYSTRVALRRREL